MDYLFLILSGVVIGLIVAAPIGPCNLICIRRTLHYGPVNGFVSGMGAAIGDGLFAIITAFGLTAIAQIIEGYSLILQIVGGSLLIVFGINTYLSDPIARHVDDGKPVREGEAASLVRAIATTFALTMTNPATMFGFAALFAGLSGLSADHPSFVNAAFVVIGVVGGSALWWFTLTTVVGLLHAKIDSKAVKLINHASGILIAIFGFIVLGHLLYLQFV
ncbi:MAG TPA: LysE family transporter [Rhizomicrobium sp.]|jgi:threonine/homoserine/homoserine lactone efflux protein|nr:LysE family transporter [Rhizomicrobium sp.]HEX4533427.1 LysE family transporter [Rhizomicrobium sp.]